MINRYFIELSQYHGQLSTFPLKVGTVTNSLIKTYTGLVNAFMSKYILIASAPYKFLINISSYMFIYGKTLLQYRTLVPSYVSIIVKIRDK